MLYWLQQLQVKRWQHRQMSTCPDLTNNNTAGEKQSALRVGFYWLLAELKMYVFMCQFLLLLFCNFSTFRLALLCHHLVVSIIFLYLFVFCLVMSREWESPVVTLPPFPRRLRKSFFQAKEWLRMTHHTETNSRAQPPCCSTVDEASQRLSLLMV